MNTQVKGPWSPDKIQHFTQDSRYPIRLACIGTDGYPQVVQLSLVHLPGRFVFLCVPQIFPPGCAVASQCPVGFGRCHQRSSLLRRPGARRTRRCQSLAAR